MLFAVHGSDRLAVRERRDALLAQQLPPDDDMALTRLDGQKCSADEFARAVQALPFFGDRRVVLIDDLLGRFEPKRRRGAEPAAEEAPSDEPHPGTVAAKNDPARAFIAVLGTMAPTTIVILWERTAIGKTNSLLKAVAKLGTVEAFEAPKLSELDDWIFARARSKGTRLKPDVPRLLAEHLGQDLEVLDEELEKLSLYAGPDTPVDAPMVRLLTAQTRQADTLQLLNAASDRRLPEALSLLHELLDNGVAPVAVVGMLGTQVRKLLQVQSLAARRLPAADIASRLAMHPYAARMAVESLRHHSAASLRELHTRLVQIDQAIKTGGADGEAALELLVLDLARGSHTALNR
ncbi:MAG TPA: DNA polymerase III subunit delta [Chloroflexia bacterium]|nr:DNA polymerase III subunit delta [Chloroflexia bacterium]